MQEISFESLIEKAMELTQSGIDWHFHMIGPACIFSQSKEQYEIIIEVESTDEIFSSVFTEKPVDQTQKMAGLAYGPDFLKKEEHPEEAEPAKEQVDSNDEFLEIMDRARACCQSGRSWHNHHLPPQCRFNPRKGKHCLVFEDETTDDALYAYYSQDPIDDLAALERLFFNK